MEKNESDNVDKIDSSCQIKKSSGCGKCWRRMMKVARLTNEGATPVNWKVVGLMTMSLFGSALSVTFIFPFLPEMVLWFGYREEEKGYYAGLVASAMFVGRALGSFFWGWLADKKGRKPVLLITLFLNGLFSLGFGFTTNFAMAMVFRFLTGLGNGTVGTVKTVLYETSDNTNQAVAMSIIALAWGGGIILGPGIGGYLASPAIRYPDVFPKDGFFSQFPYILSSGLIFVVCSALTILDFFLFEETGSRKKEEIEVAQGDVENLQHEAKTLLTEADDNIPTSNSCDQIGPTKSNKPKLSMSVEDLHCETEAATYFARLENDHEITDTDDVKNEKNISEDSALLSDHATLNGQPGCLKYRGSKPLGNSCVLNEDSSNPRDTNTTNSGLDEHISRSVASSEHELNTVRCSNNTDMPETKDYTTIVSKRKSIANTVRNISLLQILGISDVRLAILVYALFSFAVIGIEDIFAIWCSTEQRLDGLGMNPAEIGTILMVSFIPQLILQFFIFPIMVRFLGVKKTFFIGMIIQLIAYNAMPTLHLLNKSPTTLWAMLILLKFPQNMATCCSFSAASLFINNSAPPHQSGSVNGLAMAITAVARAMGPAIAGSIYAWTMGHASENIGPPFDVSFSFFLFGLCVWVTAIIGILLPERLNRQKK